MNTVVNTEKTRAVLEEKLTELNDRLQKVQLDQVQPHSVDSAEQAQERENDQVIDTIGAETQLSISQIKMALERIDAGKYGICQACGEAISPERLSILPEAVCCVKCAD